MSTPDILTYYFSWVLNKDINNISKSEHPCRIMDCSENSFEKITNVLFIMVKIVCILIFKATMITTFQF